MSRPSSSGMPAYFSWMRDSTSSTSRLNRWISPAPCSFWSRASTCWRSSSHDVLEREGREGLICRNHDMPMFLSSAISVVIGFLALLSSTKSHFLSFGRPRCRFPSTVVCNIVLMASYLSRLSTCPNHLNISSLRNSAIE